MRCTVQTQPGHVPPFWNRNAVFVANLLSLFYGNDGETNELCQEVGHIETYGGRLLPILDLLFNGPNRNLLVLESEPDPLLLDYFTDACSLTLPDRLILAHAEYMDINRTLRDKQAPTHPACDAVSAHDACWMDGFVTDQALTLFAEHTGKQLITTEGGSKRGNNKLTLHQFLERTGLPTFDTHRASDPNAALSALTELKGQGYTRAVVKSQIGASGIGMVQVDVDEHDAAAIPDYLFFEGPCLVQGWLDESAGNVHRVGSPSVQIFVNEEQAWLYDLTEQILSAASVHEGNLAPPPYLLQEDSLRETVFQQARAAATWLHEQGYRGTASADFLITRMNGDPRVILCEINARVTGATYPAVLARHLCPGDAWLLRNLRFKSPLPSKDILTRLDKHGCLYRAGAGSGLLPINFNHDHAGGVVKGQFLCLAPETEDCMEMILATQHILPVQWAYDRD